MSGLPIAGRTVCGTIVTLVAIVQDGIAVPYALAVLLTRAVVLSGFPIVGRIVCGTIVTNAAIIQDGVTAPNLFAILLAGRFVGGPRDASIALIGEGRATPFIVAILNAIVGRVVIAYATVIGIRCSAFYIITI